MVQIGGDITNFPETDDGFCCVVVAKDYLLSGARPAPWVWLLSVAKFLFEDVICRHGCVKIQISDQGQEFVNKVSTELHRLAGVEQHATSTYHPQSNGLVERQNRTVKDSIVKPLSDGSNVHVCLLLCLYDVYLYYVHIV